MPRASRASRNSSPKEAAIANILPPLDVESGRAEIYLGINQYGKFIQPSVANPTSLARPLKATAPEYLVRAQYNVLWKTLSNFI